MSTVLPILCQFTLGATFLALFVHTGLPVFLFVSGMGAGALLAMLIFLGASE